MKEQQLVTDNGRLFYQMSGTGEPLLFIHGNGEDSGIFNQQFTDFKPRHRVIAMDTRGHGRSDLGVPVLTFAQIAVDIRALLDELNIAKITIIGYSDGGNIGLYFAHLYPERIKALVIMGANFEVDAVAEKDFLEIKQHRLALNSRPQTPETLRQWNIVNLMLDQLALTEAMLRDIQVPVLVMAGEFDVIKPEHTQKIADVLPHSELFVAPGGGHDFFVTDPMVFYKRVSQFFGKLENNEN